MIGYTKIQEIMESLYICVYYKPQQSEASVLMGRQWLEISSKRPFALLSREDVITPELALSWRVAHKQYNEYLQSKKKVAQKDENGTKNYYMKNMLQ